MAIADTFSVDISGNIRRTGDAHDGASPEYYTVLELHRWLSSLSENISGSGDDLVSIQTPTPSERSTDNIITLLSPYNIDDDASQYLYDGSIIQDDGDTIYDGIVNFGSTQSINIIQNGELVQDDFWNIGFSFNEDDQEGISHRFLLKVRENGEDIDQRRLIGTARDYGYIYSEFTISSTSRGNNVLALFETDDVNNQTSIATVSGYTDITWTEGYNEIDLLNDNGDQPYFVNVQLNGRPVNDIYEYSKYLTRRGTNAIMFGLDGNVFRGITNEFDIYNATGTFQEPEPLTWDTGTAQLFAIDSTTVGSKMWVQLLTGETPTTGTTISGATSSATCQLSGSTRRVVPNVIVGQSTGENLIGAYGVGIEFADLTDTDTLTSLQNEIQSPASFRTFRITGLESGEYRVLVGPNDGLNEIEVDQFSANGTQLAGSSNFVINETIPKDTPLAGTIRAFNGTEYDRIEYDGYNGSEFALTSTLTNTISSGANVFVSYIDELVSGISSTFSAKYVSDRSLLIKIRDGGVTPIKPIRTPGVFGESGGSLDVSSESDA
jgi:hypothetical protein